MLDDLKFIHSRDASDALGVAEKQWQQLTHKFEVDLSSIDLDKIKNIVHAGMGGSAWPGIYIQNWAELKAPFEIVRNYTLPEYVSDETLFFASSHSGNTEETLAALAEAETRNCQIVVMTSGGKLLDIAKEKNYPLYVLPAGIQPRMSSFFFVKAMMDVLSAARLASQDKLAELAAASEWLKDQTGSWRPDVPAEKNPAKGLAMDLAGKSVIVYSGPKHFPAANKFKICINENAKNLAWVNQYPEFSHNEFIGWSSHPIVKPFAVVEIRSNLEHERTQKRFEVTERMLSGKRPSPFVIKPEGDTQLKQLLWTSVFCDFCSIYLALLNNVDPTPVELVERFKKELA